MAATTRSVPSWLSVATQIAAPVTIVGALLFYFGYVFSRAQYAYFGLDVDTIGLTPRDFVMRSPAPLLVPLIVLTVLTAAGMALTSRIEAHVRGSADDAGRAARVRRIAARCAVGGAAVLLVGLVLLLTQRDDEGFRPLVTAIVIAGAAVVTATALRYLPFRAAGAIAGLWVAALGSMLWAVSLTAQASGQAHAEQLARQLADLPAVILDSKQDLHLRNTVPAPEDLCWTTGSAPDAACVARADEYRYRYRGLHLLVQGPDAMFLVPGQWSPSGTTLDVPRDADVRLQFQFVNSAPRG